VGTPHINDGAGFDCILFSATDVTDRKNDELLTWTRANFDELTELPNRSLLQDRLAQELVLAERNRTEVTIMFIDLDHFKDINDSLGHGTGDEVLQEAAGRIASCLRNCDTAARSGGDEFVVLLSGSAGKSHTNEIAQRIRDSLRKTISIDDTEVCATSSIGIACYPRDGIDAASLIEHADTAMYSAMYSAKKSGRDAITFYDSAMRSPAVASQLNQQGAQ
jgi:diguanylate cyclase (GGDEF)-like protein